MFKRCHWILILHLLAPFVLAVALPATAAPVTKDCAECHKALNPALVLEWEQSRHHKEGVRCLDCHQANDGDPDGWEHAGEWISVLVTPKDCAQCHEREAAEFAASHHAKAGEILASLDNVLAEKAAGLPNNNSDAVLGCLQCHGGIVKFQRDAKGAVLRNKAGKPLLDPATWPNSGIGRMNPDGSRGSCNACHSRHIFQAKMSRSPENCGKCHLGPDHPQAEIYEESKHNIAFRANKERMALDADTWVLGKDYSAAPTCATCHTAAYMTPAGEEVANNHDIGERISWTLRPVASVRLNMVIFEDGFKEDYPEGKPLPKVGASVDTPNNFVENDKMKTGTLSRKVAKIVTWQERREKMKGVCLNCHNRTHVDNFYAQFDQFVDLYNVKFARPAQALMDDLKKDGVLRAEAPFEFKVQWVFYELWHHEGRRARHGASMMGPDYAHWHGLYEVSKNFYTEFLPAVIEAASAKSPELGKKYKERIDALMAQPEHAWMKGMTPEEAEQMRKAYNARYKP